MTYAGLTHSTMDADSEAKFDIEVRPLYSRNLDRTENELDSRYARAIVRTDTQEHLGILGPRTEPIPYKETIEETNDALARLGIYHNFTTEVYDNGAMMRRKIEFPHTTIEPVVGDVVCFSIDHFDSYNGKWALQLNATAKRLVCLNGMTRPDYIVRAYTKHTRNAGLKYSEILDKIQLGMDTFKDSSETYTKYYNTPIDHEHFEQLITKTIAYNPKHDPTQLRPEYSKLKIKALNEHWDRNSATLGSNAWAAYNAMTEWATHGATRGAAHMVERNRNQEVAKALRSSYWKNLVNESTNLRVI